MTTKQSIIEALTLLPEAIAKEQRKVLSQSRQIELLQAQIKTEESLAVNAAEGSNAQKRKAHAELLLEDNEDYQDMCRELLRMQELLDESKVEHQLLRDKFSAEKTIASLLRGDD